MYDYFNDVKIPHQREPTMNHPVQRRTFIQISAIGSAALFGNPFLITRTGWARQHALISPGCRKTKVKIAKIYLGRPGQHWPTPTLDIAAEKQKYEDEFHRMKKELSDVDFTVDELVSSPEGIPPLVQRIQEADGVLVIQLAMNISTELNALLQLQKPIFLFAAPYSGHEWVNYGNMRKQNDQFDCVLTSDTNELAAGIRTFRAMHHLRESKILNITARDLPADFVQKVQEKHGSQFMRIDRERVIAIYDSIPDALVREETKRWMEDAVEVVEPSEDEIARSCKLALAFEKLLDEEEATVITADCYGTMYRQLPAFPCIGFTRLNDKGLGGICESDLRCAMTHILLQSLSGKPGFISDPTMDLSKRTAILAHCLGSTRMDGLNGERAPYKLRTIMERQEGAVPQVRMRIGEKVTQAIMADPGQLLYFTGEIVDVPEGPRGCRTKIAVQIDGDADKLWQNWTSGLHRVTCYGDITEDLHRFCRYQRIEMIHEA